MVKSGYHTISWNSSRSWWFTTTYVFHPGRPRLHALHHRGHCCCCSHLILQSLLDSAFGMMIPKYSAPRPHSPQRPTLASLRSPSPALLLTHEAPPYRSLAPVQDRATDRPEFPNYQITSWNDRPVELRNVKLKLWSIDGIRVVLHVADRFIMVRPATLWLFSKWDNIIIIAATTQLDRGQHVRSWKPLKCAFPTTSILQEGHSHTHSHITAIWSSRRLGFGHEGYAKV